MTGLKDIDYPYFGTPFLLCATAVAATLAAHFVRSIRQEVESARQYGQYHLTTEIGRGGMGVVYRAEHRMLKRPAAIKLIRAGLATNDTAIASFEREVQLSATPSHWNTVQIYDYGRTANGDFFYVMEYLDGETLADRLNHGGAMQPDAAIHIVKQLCDGLDEAHSMSLVHRDLKPANIFLTACGSQHDIVKILDFGLAGDVDLVVIRYDDTVSVLYGRCQHRGALMADGHIEGQNLFCGVHNWDFRIDSGVSEYNNAESLYKFTATVEDDQVLVSDAEINSFTDQHPQPF